MRERPDKPALLEAIAAFLEKEVRPAVPDAALGFRVLVAANLAAVAARELQGEDEPLEAELARLRALLPDAAAAKTVAPFAKDHRSAIAALRRELARRIREGEIPSARGSAVWDHVRRTVRDELRLTSPRFDVDADLD